MLTKLPSKTRVYIFGSYLRTSLPKDLDVLVLYDTNECSPLLAYTTFKVLFDKLNEITSLPVDPTLLSYSEEYNVGFLSQIDFVEIKEINELTRAINTDNSLRVFLR